MRPVRESVRIRQLQHLLVCSIRQTLFGKADADAPKARHRLDVTLAVIVFNVDAITLFDHHRADFFVTARIGVRMEMIGNITSFNGIGLSRHVIPLSKPVDRHYGLLFPDAAHDSEAYAVATRNRGG